MRQKGQRDLAFSQWRWGTSGALCSVPIVGRGKLRLEESNALPGAWLPVAFAVEQQMLVSV